MALTTEKAVKTIERERRRQKMTFCQLADSTGIDYRTYYYWRNGRQKPSLDNFLRMLDVLGLECKIIRKREEKNEL